MTEFSTYTEMKDIINNSHTWE